MSLDDLLTRNLFKKDSLGSLVALGFTLEILAFPSQASVKCYSNCGPHTTFIKITWRAPLKMQIPTPHSRPTESEPLGVEI